MPENPSVIPDADAIREARHRAGLTQIQLAERLGVTSRAIKHWESGTRPIQHATWVLLQKQTAELTLDIGCPDADAIREARRNAGLTQTQLAELLRVTPRAIKYWESGERAMPYAAWALLQQQAVGLPAEVDCEVTEVASRRPRMRG